MPWPAAGRACWRAWRRCPRRDRTRSWRWWASGPASTPREARPSSGGRRTARVRRLRRRDHRGRSRGRRPLRGDQRVGPQHGDDPGRGAGGRRPQRRRRQRAGLAAGRCLLGRPRPRQRRRQPDLHDRVHSHAAGAGHRRRALERPPGRLVGAAHAGPAGPRRVPRARGAAGRAAGRRPCRRRRGVRRVRGDGGGGGAPAARVRPAGHRCSRDAELPARPDEPLGPSIACLVVGDDREIRLARTPPRSAARPCSSRPIRTSFRGAADGAAAAADALTPGARGAGDRRCSSWPGRWRAGAGCRSTGSRYQQEDTKSR